MKRSLAGLLFRTMNALHRRLHAIHLEEEISKLAKISPNVKLADNAKIFNPSNNKDLIMVGSNSVVNGTLYVFSHGGRIKIGEDCFVGENSKIWSADSVEIGDRVLISHNVNIHDTNAHPIDSTKRHEHFIRNVSGSYSSKNDLGILSAPVTILDDVWIGFNAVILKGVTIGKAAIVAAGSIVTSDVPEFSIVAGNPAKVVKQLIP
jgi:acetyltransferase-like isoleucine patch superfamily enzyme